MPYFDYAATTEIHPKALEAIVKTLKEYYGNPSSLHHEGIKARKLMNQTKARLAERLGCERRQIIITSSGTEANNLAIQGVYQMFPNKRYITSAVEHHATLNTMKYLKKQGADVVILPVDSTGRISLNHLKDALKVDTALVSLIYANNEIGTIQDLKSILKCVKDTNALMHLDMVQVPLHHSIDFKHLGVDFVSISAHKFYGPKGTGLLIAKDHSQIERLIHGGKQEFQKRSGTENLAGIIGMQVALDEVYLNHENENAHTSMLSHYFIHKLKESKIEFCINGPSLNEDRLHNILNIGFKDIDSQWLSFELNQQGIYVSLGSACDSDNIEPSHVLRALNVSEDYINGSLRFSFGIENTKKDIDITIDALTKIIHDA